MRLLALSLMVVAGTVDATPPVEHFTGHARYEQARISPTAKYLAVTTRQEDYEYLVVIGLADREVVYRTHFGKGWNVQNFHWATAERILVQPARRIVGRTDFSFPTGELYALNADGTDASVLFGMNAGFGKLSARAGRNEARLEAAEILHLLPDEPEHVLIGTIPFGVNKVGRARRINIHTGQTEPVVVGRYSTSRFLADRDGRVRFEYGSNVENVTEVYYLPDAGEPTLVSRGRINEGVTTPLADAGDGWYAVDNTETSTTQLVHWQPTRDVKQVLFHNDAVDIGEGLFDPDGRLIAARITEHYPDYHYVQPDAPFAKTHRRIRAAFPTEDVAFTSITTDGAKGVAVVYGDRFPSTFYLVDFRTDEIEELFQSRPWLAREDLSPMESVQLKARDGTIVHGYLTTPRGWSEGDRLPLIVLVHGGPHGIRDHWGFDTEAQLFASRGFAVLQVNFRGSGGYGKDFLYAGFGRWGREMQDDVTDATRWAVAAGFADPERLCIYGGSYGGYAALTGAFREPELYRCAVGYVGVYDLEMMYRKGDIPDRRAGVNYLKEAIGEDTAELRARSPVHNAERIRAAVMLVHGALDQRVPIAHATSLRRALKAAGNPVEVWHIERKEGHGFGNPDNRKQMYERMLAFFDDHIGRGREVAARGAGG